MPHLSEKGRGRPCKQSLARLNVALRLYVGSSGEIDMTGHPGRFVWYELITTDVAGAKAFYSDVVGWGAQDASISALDYTLFTSERSPIAGLMNLPEDARSMGATPRWMGYVEVNDVDATAERIKGLGGAVYVPPTDSNIGRISVVADPQTTTLGLTKGLKPASWRQTDLAKPGCVGWHELLAADWERAFAFYREVFGWQEAGADVDPIDSYQLFSAGNQIIGGMFTKHPEDPAPFWLFYFNVDDIDAAAARVQAGGGRVLLGPLEMPSGSWIARCGDPQGAAFALQGKRNQDGFGWSTEWDGISSRGRLVTRPRG
jgi:predicted enzyme related to lactoylglutathione lyase